MHVRTLLLATIFAGGLAACAADDTEAPVPHATAASLQDMVVSDLPSPYYHFEYDSAGRVTKASFASALSTYDVSWDGNHIAEMRDNGPLNFDRVVYLYDSRNRVSAIHYVDVVNGLYAVVSFIYDGQTLSGLRRTKSVGGVFVVDKTIALSYDAVGNLSTLTEHFPAIDGLQTEATTTDRFEQYDGRVNADGFSLLHSEFFDNLILLPGVELQRGNPGRVTRTGDGDNYQVDYTYTYDSRQRPLTKTGVLTLSNGAGAGQTFQALSTFSYY